jgi:maltooligosyltrehalose trehalohydrolase
LGVEYDEQRPFQFFTDHIDPAIAEATREGRRAEVERTTGSGSDAPDPQAVETYERSKLERRDPDALIRELLALRPTLPRELDVNVDGTRVTLTRGEATLELDFDAKRVELKT